MLKIGLGKDMQLAALQSISQFSQLSPLRQAQGYGAIFATVSFSSGSTLDLNQGQIGYELP